MKYKFFYWLRLLSIPLCVLVSACSASGPKLQSVPLELNTPHILEHDYRIQPGDDLDIKFYYNHELNEQMTVRPDGKISLQLIKEIMAAGLTPEALSTALTERYSQVINKPEITVIVRTFSSHRVYLDGEFKKPGMVNLIKPLTLLQAIAQAGGLKDTASRSDVLIVRHDENRKRTIIETNIEKILNGTNGYNDIYLMPADIVYVSKTYIANINVWVDQYLRRNVPVQLYIPID